MLTLVVITDTLLHVACEVLQLPALVAQRALLCPDYVLVMFFIRTSVYPQSSGVKIILLLLYFCDVKLLERLFLILMFKIAH